MAVMAIIFLLTGCFGVCSVVVGKGDMDMEPKFIVDCEAPETWGVKTHHPSMSFFYTYESAMKFIRSKLSLSDNIDIKHKHIWSIRENGKNHGDWLFRTAG